MLLAVQPALIHAGRRAQHRLVGRAGVLVGLAFVASSVLIAHRSLARMSAEQFLREGVAVYLPLAMACIFASALAMAIRWRGSTPVHARFMAATALPLLDPLFARILYSYGPPLPSEFLYQAPAFVAVMAALAALGRSMPGGSTGRCHFLWFSVGVAALLAGFFVVPRTEPWLQFAAWIREWPVR